MSRGKEVKSKEAEDRAQISTTADRTSHQPLTLETRESILEIPPRNPVGVRILFDKLLQNRWESSTVTTGVPRS